MQLGMGYWASKALLSAVELGLFSELAKGPLTLDELTTRLRISQRSAQDFFDALVALGMLDRRDSQYMNTPESDYFLDRARPSYIGGLLEMLNARLYGAWGHLTEALRSGEPPSEAKDSATPFDTLYATPEKLEEFLSAMTGVSLPNARQIAAAFPWRDYKSFVDVGAAQGGFAVELAEAHPHLSGAGFDLPAVRPVFERYVKAHGLSERVRFHAGNFFTDSLPSADVLVMGHILHDWDLPTRKMLIKKAFAALHMGGALIVYDMILDEERRANAPGLLMSLNMLIETRGGSEYKGSECMAWMREAGFSATRTRSLSGPHSMVVGTK